VHFVRRNHDAEVGGDTDQSDTTQQSEDGRDGSIEDPHI
jgi:hypothetical protein